MPDVWECYAESNPGGCYLFHGFITSIMLLLFQSGLVGVVQGYTQKRLLAALNDVTQSASADASIMGSASTVGVNARGILFSFTCVRSDGVTCKVTGVSEISKFGLYCRGIAKDYPEGSTQKVMYLKADPKVCRLEKLAQDAGENCNDVMIAVGSIFVLMYVAGLLTCVTLVKSFIFIMSLLIFSCCCGLCIMPIPLLMAMSETFPGSYELQECDESGNPLALDTPLAMREAEGPLLRS